jgi:AcrR family transcriptional regulator
MLSGARRSYRMTARAAAVEATREAILQAMVELWLEHPYDDLTLNDVATRAGVSRQTVFRQFGSKDDLLSAAARWAAPQMDERRAATPGDIDDAARRVVAGYETMGDANVRALEIEGRVAVIDDMLRRGRSEHREWVERTFAPQLPPGPADRELAVTALYAATDVMVWKLLRRDFGLPVDRTVEVVATLIRGVLERPERAEHR